MNDNAFYECKYFLEQRMQELPDNAELVKAYIVLIEQKTKFDIAYFSQTSEIQKNWNDNQAKMNAAWHESQAKVATKQIEVGGRLINSGIQLSRVGLEMALSLPDILNAVRRNSGTPRIAPNG